MPIHKGFRNRRPTRVPTCPLYPEDLALATDVRQSTQTEVTPTTRDHRIDGHRQTIVEADAGKLMAHNERRNAKGTLARETFELGAALPHRRYFDEHLAVTRHRFIDIKHPYFKRCGVSKGPRASISSLD